MTARQNDPETVREEGINVLLEQSLRGHGPQVVGKALEKISVVLE